MGLLHGVFSIRYRMDQIISGTVLIVLAAGFTAYLFDRDAVAEGKFSPIAIPALSQIPVVGRCSSRTHRSPTPTILLVGRPFGLFYRAGGCVRGPAASIPGPPTRWASRESLSLPQHDAGREGWRGWRAAFWCWRRWGSSRRGVTGGRFHRAGRDDLRQLDALRRRRRIAALRLHPGACRTSAWPAWSTSRASFQRDPLRGDDRGRLRLCGPRPPPPAAEGKV